jgi:hypothetical protein
MSNQLVEVRVQQGDVLRFEADVLALKYAQAHYGVDAVAAQKLSSEGRKLRLPKPWKHTLEKGVSGIAAQRVLFMGVPELHSFGYGEIRKFARSVLSALAADAPDIIDLALTVHGPGYGLDEAEAFAAEIAGLLDGVRSGDLPGALRKITLVELDAGSAQRLQTLLSKLLPGRVIEPKSVKWSTVKAMQQLRSAGAASSAKPRVCRSRTKCLTLGTSESTRPCELPASSASAQIWTHLSVTYWIGCVSGSKHRHTSSHF